MTTENLSRLAGNLLTVKEAMGVLRLGRTRFYELVAAGRIDIIKLGQRSTRVKVESLEKLIANGI
jgi:excisionase family DNA binding protein